MKEYYRETIFHYSLQKAVKFSEMHSFGPQNIVTVQLVSDQISINLRKSQSRGNGDS